MQKSTTGQLIRAARERKYVGQRELARAAGIPISTLWTIEDGRHTPRPATIRKIAKALDMTADELMHGRPISPPTRLPRQGGGTERV